MKRIGPIKHKPKLLPPFQSLVQAIIYQQLSTKAAGTILKRFLHLFKDDDFPEPAQVMEMDAATLRATGLSRGKTAYIIDTARKSLLGEIPSLEECDHLTDETIIERLITIKGVGRWTAEMFLIFNLGRPDVLPVHDLGIRRGYQIAYRKRKLPEPGKLQRIGLKWTPHRTTVALYLWRNVDSS